MSNPLSVPSQPIKTPVVLVPWVQDDRYKPLSTYLKKDGFDLSKLDREQDVAIYRKSKGDYCGFEVVIVRNREEYTIAGKVVPAAEVYPSSEDWGHLGFTYADYDRAFTKFKALLKARN